MSEKTPQAGAKSKIEKKREKISPARVAVLVVVLIALVGVVYYQFGKYNAPALHKPPPRQAFLITEFGRVEGAAKPDDRCVLASGDLNGDGKADLALGGKRVRLWYATDVGGALSSPEEIELPGRCGALCCADLTGDGKTDLAAFDGAGGGLYIYAQKPGRGIARKPSRILEAPRGINACLAMFGALGIVSPLDGNYVYYAWEEDRLEKAWEYPLTFKSKAPLRLLWLGDEAGGATHYVFAPHSDGFESARLCETCSSLRPYDPTDGLGFPVAMAGGDFGGDGDHKLALLNRMGRLYVVPVLRDVDAVPPGPTAIADGLPGTGGLAAADLNADNRDDIVFSGGDKLIVFLSCEDGKFLRAAEAPFKGATECLVLADLTGDGRPEAAALDSGGSLVIWKLGEKPGRPPAP